MILAPVFSEAMYTVDDLAAEDSEVWGGKGKGAYAQAFGLMNVAYATGSLVGPLIGGLGVEKVGWGGVTLGIGVMTAICVVPAILGLGGRRKQGTELVVDDRESILS